MPSPLQERVAAVFFALPESSTFAVAGGSALVLAGLVDRTTKDLGLFASTPEVVRPVARALGEGLRASGLESSILRDFDTFARLEVRDGDSDATLVDIASDF